MNLIEGLKSELKDLMNEVIKEATPAIVEAIINAQTTRTSEKSSENETMRLKDVCTYLNMSESTIKKLQGQGSFPLPCCPTGSRLQFWYKSDLDEWLKKQKPKATRRRFRPHD